MQIIGWLYQYYNTELKAETFDLLKKNVKVTKERIPSATQLFTPDWIVRYMVENSLGRLWLEGHPNQALRESWKYYLDEAEQEPEVEAQLVVLRAQRQTLRPEDITLIDPCMGSGHILVYAFDVLMQIYESEGWSQRDAAASIVQKNLYGLDIDRRAAQLAYFAVMMKARQYDRRFLTRGIQPNLYHPGAYAEGQEFGSLLIVDELEPQPEQSDEITLFDGNYGDKLNTWNFRSLLARQYDVVVTNPPYMAVSNGDAALNKYIKDNYPDSKGDLFAAFIERCGRFSRQNGYQSMITQHSWMFLSSFEKLRAKLLQSADIVNMVHLGARAFEEIGGEVVQTTSFVMRRAYTKGYKGTYCRLVEPTTQQGKENMFLAGENRYTAEQINFSKIPGSPVAYWASEIVLNTFDLGTPLFNISRGKSGQNTGDNNRFLRLWHEVIAKNIGLVLPVNYDGMVYKWIPYNKGGEFRRWYGNYEYVVNWKDDGKDIKEYATERNNGKHWSRYIQNLDCLYKEGITWSIVTSGTFSMRYLPEGFICDYAGCAVFPEHKLNNYLLALFNTKYAQYVLKILNPTINYQPGNIGSVPVVLNAQHKDSIDSLTKHCLKTSKSDWDSYETSWDFKRHPLV